MEYSQNSLETILDRLRMNVAGTLDDLRQFADRNPNNEAAWAHLSWILNSLGYIHEARERTAHLLTLLPQSPDAHALYARIAFQLGETEQTIQYFLKAITLAREPYTLQIEFLETLLHLGRPFTALRLFGSLWARRTSERPISLQLLKKILAAIILRTVARRLPSSLRNRIFSKAYLHYSNKMNWTRAYLVARGAASLNPTDSLWPERAAEALYQNRNVLFPEYDKEIYWRSIAFHRGGSGAASRLARVHLHAGHFQSVLDIFQEYPPASPEEKTLCAHALASAGQIETAVSLYRSLGGTDSSSWLQSGIVHLKHGNYSEALGDLEKALHIDSPDPLTVFLCNAALQQTQAKPLNAAALDDLLQDTAQRHRWISRISEVREDWDIQTQRLLATRRLRTIACPQCGAERFAPLILDPYTQWIRGRCQSCGLHYVNPQPRPETIPDLYTNETSQGSALQRYFRQSLEQLLAQPPAEAAAMFARKEKWWEPEFSLPRFEEERGIGRRMLDVGCSVGTQMLEYRNRGWDVCGIDLDGNAVEVARSIQLDARISTLEEAELEEESFDLIAMMDVIEHVPDPKPVLAKLHTLLKPGGVLKLKTPCAESIIHYQYGPHWTASDTHLLYYTRRLLHRALREAGFTPIATRSYLEADKIAHTYSRWRSFSLCPLFDALVLDWDIGDSILFLARKE